MIKEKISKNEIVFSVSLVMLAGVTFNFANLLTVVTSVGHSEYVFLFWLAGGCFLGFMYIPFKLIYLQYNINKIPKIHIKSAIIIFVFIFFTGLYISGFSETIHPFFIAVAEEYLFRHLILEVLKKKYSKIQSMMIGSIIFAILLHLNGNLLFNMLTKIPFSLFLYYLADRKGIQYAIGAHWLNNLLVSQYVI